MNRSAEDRKAEAARYQQMTEEAQAKPQQRPAPSPAGFYSNQRIQQRNGGVRHQFIDDIGGCSANYR